MTFWLSFKSSCAVWASGDAQAAAYALLTINDCDSVLFADRVDLTSGYAYAAVQALVWVDY